MELSELVKSAVDSGDIRVESGEVEISAKASPDNQAHTRPYTRLVALTVAGMQALCGGKIEPATAKPEEGDDNRTDEEKANGVCDYFNYGFDLSVRSRERSALAASLEGPEKAIAKAVKSLVDNAGFDAETARATVIAQRQKAGLPV